MILEIHNTHKREVECHVLGEVPQTELRPRFDPAMGCGMINVMRTPQPSRDKLPYQHQQFASQYLSFNGNVVAALH